LIISTPLLELLKRGRLKSQQKQAKSMMDTKYPSSTGQLRGKDASGGATVFSSASSDSQGTGTVMSILDNLVHSRLRHRRFLC
jgi:hypothetical protein